LLKIFFENLLIFLIYTFSLLPLNIHFSALCLLPFKTMTPLPPELETGLMTAPSSGYLNSFKALNNCLVFLTNLNFGTCILFFFNIL